MTQIVVTIEDDSNLSIIRNAIKMIKGVKNTFVRHFDAKVEDEITDSRLKALEQLAGCISPSMIDMNDEKTRYILNK